MEQILGYASLLLIVAFVWWAFRQGKDIPPSGDSGGGGM